MGNLNFRMDLESNDMVIRIQASSRACQVGYGRFRDNAEQQDMRGTKLNWRGHAYSRLWSLPDHQRHTDTRKSMTVPAEEDVGRVSLPPLGRSRSASFPGSKGQRSETGEHQSPNIDSNSSSGGAGGGATVATRNLGNLHQIAWARGLVYDVNLPFLRRDRSSSSSVFPRSTSSPPLGAAAAAADASRVVEGAPRASQDASSEMNVDDGGTAARVMS